jgi:hypothetical protein
MGVDIYNSVTLFCHSVIIEFLFVILSTIAHLQFKFDIWIRNRNTQARFEFGHGRMNFETFTVLFALKLNIYKPAALKFSCFMGKGGKSE